MLRISIRHSRASFTAAHLKVIWNEIQSHSRHRIPFLISIWQRKHVKGFTWTWILVYPGIPRALQSCNPSFLHSPSPARGRYMLEQVRTNTCTEARWPWLHRIPQPLPRCNTQSVKQQLKKPQTVITVQLSRFLLHSLVIWNAEGGYVIRRLLSSLLGWGQHCALTH